MRGITMSLDIAINQATTMTQWGLLEAIEGYARNGVHRIGVWRSKLEECGIPAAKQALSVNGVQVTALNRVGPFDLLSGLAASNGADDAQRAIDETAELGAEYLMLFPGGLPDGSKDLAGARERLAEITLQIAEMAERASVRLALEPLHPMLAAERSCLNTMTAAVDLCQKVGRGTGIVVDVYHTWWDPSLEAEIRRAGNQCLLGFHVNDWLVPTTDLLMDRGMMGDGVIDMAKIHRWMRSAGYRGPVEVEIFSERHWWRQDPDVVVATAVDRCRRILDAGEGPATGADLLGMATEGSR